jgi:IstB-like ATP binding protein
MLSPPTMDQLQALKLTARVAAWTAQQPGAANRALACDERLTPLVETEWRARANARLTRPLPAAKLPGSQACVEGIDYPARRAGQGRRPPVRHRPLERRAPPGAHPRGDGDREDAAIVKSGLDRCPLPEAGPAPRPVKHDPRRGPTYYQ